MVTGMIGMIFAALGVFVLREPPRAKPPAPKKVEGEEDEALITPGPRPSKPGCRDFIKGFGKASRELISNPTSRNCLMGSALRFFGGYSLAFYLPIYF